MDEKEILKGYHKHLSETLRSREAELIKFIGIIIPALAVFGWSVWAYFDSKIVAAELLLSILGFKIEATNKLFLLTGGFWAGIILCSWGMLLTMKLGYNHRTLQIVMSRLEIRLGINRFRPVSWNKNWEEELRVRLWGKILFPVYFGKSIGKILPETYRLHFYMFIWSMIVSLIVLGILINKEVSSFCKTLILAPPMILNFYFVWRNIIAYRNKLIELNNF